MRNGLLLVPLLACSMVSAQPGQRTLPEGGFTICSAPSDCILVEKRDGGYVGLIEGGTKQAWSFRIDDFRLEHLKLTGISTDNNPNGGNQVVVIKGKPDVIRDGIAHCKARYIVGRKSTSHKVTVTWQPPPPNIPNLAH
jgi:hypothetical protein